MGELLNLSIMLLKLDFESVFNKILIMKNFRILFFFILVFGFTKLHSETIPFIYQEGKIIIKVEVDNKAYNFVFDTGAITVISNEHKFKAFATEFNLDATDANGENKLYNVYSTDKLKIGKERFKDLKFISADISWISERACMKIDGILGANAMDGKIWTIDFENKTINFDDRILLNTKLPNPILIPFKKHHFTKTPSISVKINEKDYDFEFDTGSNMAFSVDNSIFNTVKKGFFLESEGYLAQGLHSNSTGKGYFSFTNVEIGDGKFEHELLLGVGEKSINLLGTLFMENYLVVINFKEDNVLLYKNNADKTTYENFGIALADIEGKVKIVRKWNFSETSTLNLNETIAKFDEMEIKNSKDVICEINKRMKNNNKISIETESGTKLTLNKIDFRERLLSE